jgi:alpha-beta hydrolase superfamily lysophospholipase
VYHGLGASKEVQQRELAWLADAGFRGIGIDAPHHGERKDGVLDQLASDPDPHPGFIRIVRSAAEEIAPIVGACLTKFEGNIGIVGVSLGGYVAYAAVPAHRRIRVCVPILGSPDWTGNGLEPPQELQQLMEQAPVRRPHLFPPCALFAANAGRDAQVPPGPSRRFVERLREEYRACPERLRYREFPESEHMMREQDWNDLWKDTLSWLDRFLP